MGLVRPHPDTCQGSCHWVEHLIAGLDIVDVGLGSRLGLSHLDIMIGDDVRDWGFGVIQVPADDGFSGTDDDASGLVGILNAVCTVIALGGRAFVWIDVQGVVRTCLHTRLAANTAVIVEIDNPIITGKQGIGWANGCARCILTMVASMDAEFSG